MRLQSSRRLLLGPIFCLTLLPLPVQPQDTTLATTSDGWVYLKDLEPETYSTARGAYATLRDLQELLYAQNAEIARIASIRRRESRARNVILDSLEVMISSVRARAGQIRAIRARAIRSFGDLAARYRESGDFVSSSLAEWKTWTIRFMPEPSGSNDYPENVRMHFVQFNKLFVRVASSGAPYVEEFLRSFGRRPAILR